MKKERNLTDRESSVWTRISIEREYQREKWGMHDACESRDAGHFPLMAIRYIGRAVDAGLRDKWSPDECSPDEYVEAMVKVAALCVAGIDWIEGRSKEAKSEDGKIDLELYECVTCSSMVGATTLCDRCYAARKVAGKDWKGPLPNRHVISQ